MFLQFVKPEVELDKMFHYHILTKQTGFFSSKMRHERHNFDIINVQIYSCLSIYIKPFDSGTGGEQYRVQHTCVHTCQMNWTLRSSVLGVLAWATNVKIPEFMTLFS